MFDQQLDTNGDGVLTLLEVAAHVSQLSDDADEGMQVADVVAAVAARPEVHFLFKDADANHDGVVTWNEFGARYAYLDSQDRYQSAVGS